MFPNVGICELRLYCGDQRAAMTCVVLSRIVLQISDSEARPLPSSQVIIPHGDHDEGCRDFQTSNKESKGQLGQKEQGQAWLDVNSNQRGGNLNSEVQWV